MLSTCRSIEMPPKPRRNAVKIKLIESFLQGIPEIAFIPFVISKKPLISGEIKLVSMFKTLNKGDKQVEMICNKPLAFKIEIIHEKITTKPPIRRIVVILLIMLFDKISPRFEKETFLFSL